MRLQNGDDGLQGRQPEAFQDGETLATCASSAGNKGDEVQARELFKRVRALQYTAVCLGWWWSSGLATGQILLVEQDTGLAIKQGQCNRQCVHRNVLQSQFGS